ncbi:MAG: RelA/SpoT domain-containing protein [Aurantimonas coralicida]
MVLDNWRASHSYVLNTFQANLRLRAKGKDITVAQRLKRRPTIIDKLRREPTMQLNTMHDMAGCRLIFENIEELEKFRLSMIYSRFKHKPKSFHYVVDEDRKPIAPGIRHSKRIDRYNYIISPKQSGYRGVHDVYEYNVNTAGGKSWNGLHLEIQYRTIYQHAWATAVEVADLVTTNRIKFSEGDYSHERFFLLTSEMIARAFEGIPGALPDLSDSELISEFNTIEDKIGMLSTFRRLRTSEKSDVFRTNTLLIFFASKREDGAELEIETFDDLNQAIARYSTLERELAGVADVVLVRSDSEASVRLAYKNYFSDTVDFVSYVEQAIEVLQ